MFAVQIMILAVRSFPLLCTLYVAASWLTSEETILGPISFALPLSLVRPIHRYVALPWAHLEALFAIFYAYAARRIQAPGPKPLYSRRFLNRVFSRALRSGLADPESISGKSTFDDGDAEEVDRRLGRLPGSSSSSSTLRQRHGSKINGHTGSEREDEDPEIWFQDNYLDPSDPRAVKFQQDQARWFWVPQGSDARQTITRRDAARWLSWSLFNCNLEEVENEHKRLHSTGDPREQARIANTVKAELVAKYSTIEDRVSVDEDEEDPDLKKVLASPGEWVDAGAQGTRLDYVRKARRIIEARQGFPYPLGAGRAAPKGEVEGEGSDGGQSTTESMRLTLDPVRVQSRPLLLYCVTQSLSALTLLFAIHKGGFTLQTEGRLSFLVKVPKGWSPDKAADPSTKGKYRPTVFLHGLGVGLAQYSSLVHELAQSDLSKTHPLMIPLQPHTSQNIFSRHFLKPLGHHEMVRCLRKAMRKLHWDDCGLQILSHSMGTIVHSWLLKSLGTKVKRSCFVDPVCVRLWIPDVAGNFVYLKPQSSVALLMRYFVGTELGTANALCRHFDWASALLWPEDEIPNVTDRHYTTFFLAGQDAILSCKETRQYLLEHGVQEVTLGSNAAGKKRRGGLVVDWQAAHGELLMKDGPGLSEVTDWLIEEDP